MASKAKKAKKAAEAAAEASPGIRKKLEALVKKAEEALKGGVAEKVVKGATAGVRKAGHLANPKTILAAEKRLIDAITQTKRYKSGQHYTIGPGGGAKPGRKRDPKHLAKQVTARAAVYGTGATIAGAAGSAASLSLIHILTLPTKA